MNRKTAITLCTLFTLSMSVLAVLYATSPITGKTYRQPFTRNFNDTPLEKIAELDVEFNSFYFAGSDSQTLFLGNYTAPTHLLKANTDLNDTSHTMITMTLDSIVDPKNFKLSVDPPDFYIFHGTIPTILHGDTSSWIAKPVGLKDDVYFSDAVPLGKHSFAIRYYSTKSNTNELAKYITNPPGIVVNDELLQKQVDGLFCVDGKIHFSKKLNKVVYTYFYKNEITIADTSLDLFDRIYTLDTFKTVHIKISKIGATGNQSMLSAPPLQTNGATQIAAQYLFIQAPLISINEDLARRDTSTLIDVYDLSKIPQYCFSFYIPDVRGNKMSDFHVYNNCKRIAILHNRNLVTYNIEDLMNQNFHTLKQKL